MRRKSTSATERSDVGSNGRPTISDVARLAGVSAQTVSNFLTGRTAPRDRNRVKLEKAIEALDYRPSAAARALRSQRSNFIGLLLEEAAGRGIPAMARGLQEPLHTLFLHGAASRARDLGLFITTVLTWPGETEANALNLIREGRVDGIICSTEALGPERLERFQRIAEKERVPIVLLQEHCPSDALHTVSAQDEAGVEQVVEHLVQNGHQHVAVVTVSPPWPGPIRRVSAFLDAARRAKLAADEWRCSEYSAASVRSRVASELRRPDRPTGIFAVNDIIAVAVIQQATDLGLDVPGDCSVVGFGDFDVASYFSPPITTVRVPGVEMGARAVDKLVRALSGEPNDGPVSLEVEFVTRATTGKVRFA